MPRIPVITTWNERIKPTTEWELPRMLNTFTCDSTLVTCDSILFTCDTTTLGEMQIVWNTPRKLAILSLANGEEYQFADGEEVELAGGIETNILTTNWI